MAERKWEVTQVCFCDHVGQEVALETEMIYPIDFLPDPPRVAAQRCSLGMRCNQFGTAACKWAGTNPDVDPFHQ